MNRDAATVRKLGNAMYAKLKRLEANLINKNRELNNIYRRHKMASAGNMNYDPNRINLNTYTNANYMRNVRNAIRVVYNEREPLMRRYNKSAAKYRRVIGLPPMARRGQPWRDIVSFGRIKRSTQPLPNVNNIYNRYRSRGMQTSSGGGYSNHLVTLGMGVHKFYPNVQLLNALLLKANKEHKAATKIQAKFRERAYRPGTGSFFKKAQTSFHRRT